MHLDKIYLIKMQQRRCINLMNSERIELLNEDAQMELYLFILGILAGR